MKSSAAEYFRSLSPVKDSSLKSGRCHCCPYGYHIDLDFVRYCQALTQGAKNDNPALVELKRMKKARRRQTKSMEAMLGIAAREEDKAFFKENCITSHNGPETKLSTYECGSTGPVPPPRDKKRFFSPPSPPPRKQSLTHPALRSPPPPDIINSSSLLIHRRNEAASDALNEAVLDFEEILESSKEYPKRRSRIDGYQPYSTIDLLHHTPYSSQGYQYGKGTSRAPSGTTVARSNSLPLLHDANGLSRSTYSTLKEPLGMSQSYTYSNSYSSQSIRDQMATGLSRLKELEEEVKGIPSLKVKINILKEEKRILLEQLRYYQKGHEPPSIPFVIEKDYSFESSLDSETRLETLRKFTIDKERRRVERKRSLSPMRVNLRDFHSYRRARRGSLSEGSDTESAHSNKGQDRSGDKEETRLYISEWNDRSSNDTAKNTSYSLPGTPMIGRKGFRDAAVSCRVLTRDVGVSYVAPRSRSIGTLTDKIEDFYKEVPDKKREIKPKPCMQCFRRNQKTFESRSVGTTTPKHDSGHLSISSLSNESFGSDDLEIKLQELDIHTKNALLAKLGKKSPIISRLSSPQLFPPSLTFDNSTNTEPVLQRDQRLNTTLEMEDIFTREQLNELIEDAKLQWEATQRSKKIVKAVTSDRGTQTIREEPLIKMKPFTHSVGIVAKPITRDAGVSCSSAITAEKKTSAPKVRSIGCGGEVPLPSKPWMKSIGVGDCKITDGCPECSRKKSLPNVRSIGVGDCRLSDVLCEKCKNLHVRNIGVGDSRITDNICKNCKSKQASVATTPEVERRSFGSSGVKICDKCHEAITSVAKDFVGVIGPSPSTAVISQTSKIPRLIDYPKPDEKSPTKPEPELSIRPKSQTLPMSFKEQKVLADVKSIETLSTTSSFSVKTDKPFIRTDEKLTIKPKGDNISSSSSVVSSSLPSIGGSPQVKRVPYSRQETYTKIGSGVEGFVNPAFEELADSKQEGSTEKSKSSSKKEIPEKPKREKSFRKKIEKSRESPEKSRENDAVIKGRAEEKSSSSSSEEDEDAVSFVGSSIITEETSSLRASTDTVNKDRKKAQPSRGMRAALKVLNDSIGKPVRSGQQLTNAINIIQREWFKISSQKDADPHAVEEYMDAFEEYSKGLLHRVVNLSDINGNTAMHYAVSHGNFDVVSVLLDSKVCNINQQNKAGYTAIMLVALAQIKNDAHECVVKKLFESGDVNIKASQHGQTALMLAVSHGRLDMVRMLINAGANANIQDEDGSTALMCSAEHGHLAIVRFLVAQPDTDLYLMDNDGSTALTIAVEAGHKDVGVLLYKQMNLSRGNSPYSSVRGSKRPRTPTMARSAITPPPRNSAPSSPGRSRKSSGIVSPAHTRQSSASLSNLIL
ncbi:KN motif and ankyrin repeat domain-containing protein 1 [Armadillidium nasatum]|uniref:KN motif and ankyrin repeat domain-containing protein 1 n=1 Tax=Armadillidium nasatum TaxID=96803 RepID=A0A5N5TET9_9CRUS|nr:KN motif and ankyrin repeat domain-containing protein 1 [Armadillidium nasatum]